MYAIRSYYAETTGFPIFRSESMGFVQYVLEHQEPDLPAEPEQPAEVKLKSIVLDFTQPRVEKHDFRIINRNNFV